MTEIPRTGVRVTSSPLVEVVMNIETVSKKTPNYPKLTKPSLSQMGKGKFPQLLFLFVCRGLEKLGTDRAVINYHEDCVQVM